MHELGITQQVLDIASSKAKEAGALRVNQINLVIGDMSTVIDESVQFYFDFLSKDTIFQGARLSFRRIPIKLKCEGCGNTFVPLPDSWICPKCRQQAVEVIGGKEFYIDSIEVDS
jgi:hydrogenase nickel incorporation protein HypA/HybF